MKKTLLAITLILGVAGTVGWVLAQRYDGGGRGDRGGAPQWQQDQEFAEDVFTFVRIRYNSGYDEYGQGGYDFDRPRRGRRGGFGSGRWATDYPDSDLNLSFRLQQLTSMEVDPQGRVLELTDPRLFDYPFIYIVEPGGLRFSGPEVQALRRYLLNGGFLMVDDFWGEQEWWNFYNQIKRVFPDREPVELPLDHPIFHAVFDLKEKPQIPSIDHALNGRYEGRTWERPDAQTPHYKALYDDRGRMMAIICHNTDLGDGWEREGENEWYFHEFSEKKAYPLGINIVFYAMTH
ncbi:MAG: DUF4159 domain-containing protein [Sedimentisphaerales bacterium]|nr:DUF4159 domain-containing protein [Sedimentisphaerales bacterium]